MADGYEVLLRGMTLMDLGLMEGPLTLPLLEETRFEISNLYGWIPRVEHVELCDGTVLVPGRVLHAIARILTITGAPTIRWKLVQLWLPRRTTLP